MKLSFEEMSRQTWHSGLAKPRIKIFADDAWIGTITNECLNSWKISFYITDRFENTYITLKPRFVSEQESKTYLLTQQQLFEEIFDFYDLNVKKDIEYEHV